MIQILCY